jgi:hypothetical protein
MVKFHIEEKAIKHFEASDFKKLDDYLLGWAKFTGITPAPDKQTRDMLIVFLQKNFAYFTLQEMTNAFNLAIARKLPIKDINHYNQLSGQWVSQILQSYQIERNKALSKYNDELAKLELENGSEISEEEQDKIMDQAIKSAYKKYKDSPSEGLVDMGNSMYNYMERKGIINLSVSEKNELLSKAKNQVIRNLQLRKMQASSIKKLDTQKIIDSVVQGKGTEAQREAKRMAVQQEFDELIKEDKSIMWLLKRAEDQQDK